MLISAGKLLLWISFIFIYIVHDITRAQPDFNSYDCVESVNFTVNSIYQINLDNTLSALPNMKSGQGFYDMSSGQGQDRVNFVALCRGDVNANVCQSCLNDSTVKLRELCPNQKEAVGYYDYCLLKYSHQTILGDTGIRFYVFLLNIQKASDQVGFNRALRPMMDQLRLDAAAGDTQLKFATGNTTGPGFTTIYGLVQCTPDLSERQCNACLEDAFNQFNNSYSGRIGGRALLPMCNFRYEIREFFNESTSIIPQRPSSPPSPPLPPLLSPPSPPLPPLLSPSPSQPPQASRLIPPPPGKERRTTRTVTIVISVVMVGVIIISISFYIFTRLRRKKQLLFLTKSNEDETMDLGTVESLRYNFDIVRAATNDFSENNKLGKGGFGVVYKGIFGDGQEIAVKRLARDSGQGDIEFQNEVLLLAKLQHRNLVRLLGFSLEGNERILIYEFMPNASLDQFIFGKLLKVCLF